MAAVLLPRDPEGQGEDSDRKFNMCEPCSYVATRTGDDSCTALVVTSGVHSLVAIDVVSLDKRLVLQRILDLDGGRLEESSFSLAVVSPGHSSPSIVAANSR